MYQIIQKVVGAIALMMLMLTSPVWADFYVIPVHKKIKNVVTVAKSGGQYTDVKAAIDSIMDAGATNPYLVYIGPGIYDVNGIITLKPYVSVMGSGTETTMLRALSGKVNTDSRDSSAVIVGANHSAISQLSIENWGGNSTYSIGIYLYNTSMQLDAVDVETWGGNTNYALYGYSTQSKITHSTFKASGGGMNAGIFIEYSSPTIVNVSTTAGNGPVCHGILNENSSSTLNNVTAYAYNGNISHGIHNFSSTGSIIRNCTFKAAGTTNDIYGAYGGKISFSTMIGGYFGTTCTFCVDENGADMSSN
ncbi:MAG: hypothetical protein JXK05_07485 [Campylobacterales bacterium]|nr:hypothetical protein [Campylobacterales bacterium]